MHNRAMQWMGKLFGAALGFVALGPAGSVLGALVGHHLDAGFGSSSAARARRLFFEVTFEAMGRVAKLDGRVSEDEIRAARRIMDGMALAPEQVRAAIDRFTAGKRAAFPLVRRLGELARACGGRRELARTFVQIQLEAALGGGEYTAEKRRFVARMARELGLGEHDVAELETIVRSRSSADAAGASGPTLEDAYRALAVEPSASDEEVKRAYRRLMSRHHPDKLVSRGLPESMIEVAEQKTHEVRTAYERIRDHRGFK